MSDAIAHMRNTRMGEFGCDLDDDHPEAGLLDVPAFEGQGVGQADNDELLNVAADDAQESADVVETGNDPSDPTAGIEFDAAADPTEGVDFDAVAVPGCVDEPKPAEADDVTVAAMDVEAAAAELEMPGVNDKAHSEADDIDYASLSEEADADTIGATFNS